VPSLANIALGIALGSAAGLVALRVTDSSEPVSLAVEYLAIPFSKIWFNALFMMVIPLVISTLAVGVVRVRPHAGARSGSDLAARPAIDWKHTLLALLALTGGMIGLALASVVPLESDRRTVIASVLNAYNTASTAPSVPATFDLDTLLRVVPRNPIQAMVTGDLFAILFIGLLTGVVLAQLPDRHRQPMAQVLHSLVYVAVRVIANVLWLAPAAALFVFFAAAAGGMTDTFRLATSGLAMLAGLGIFRAVVIAIPRTIAPPEAT
jgi:Na+/H+-dicarboxylate symporter